MDTAIHNALRAAGDAPGGESGAEPRGEPGLLSACPQCSYLLHGLPTCHRCPECGLEIDRRWMIVGGAALRQAPPQFRVLKRILWYGVAAYAIFVFYTLFTMHRGAERLAIAGAICVTIIGMAVRRLRRRYGFVAIGPEGVQWYDGRLLCTLCKWPEIGRARYDNLRESVIISTAGRDLHLGKKRYFDNSAGEADRCVKAINSYTRSEPEPARQSIDRTDFRDYYIPHRAE